MKDKHRQDVIYKCKTCGREFKTKQQLGGHVGHAHPKSAETNSSPADQQSQAKTASEELTESEQIRRHRKQGLSYIQLTTKLGFKPSTVREEIARELIQEKKSEEESEDEKTSALPLVIRNGKGEMIAPEAVYWQIAATDGLNGERDFKALMMWFAAIEMVRRLTEIRKGEAEAYAISSKPMLEMMERSRQELDAAAARAKDSSMALAEAAAAGAAARATIHIDERFDELKESKKEKADIATVPDPMKGLMARTMEMLMNQVTGMLLGNNQGGNSNPGLVDMRTEMSMGQ